MRPVFSTVLAVGADGRLAVGDLGTVVEPSPLPKRRSN